MPTERRRYQITETDAVARALNAAAKHWPDEPRSRLVLRTITAGGTALEEQTSIQKRLTAIRRIQGTYTDAYDPGYLRELRADWPA